MFNISFDSEMNRFIFESINELELELSVTFKDNQNKKLYGWNCVKAKSFYIVLYQLFNYDTIKIIVDETGEQGINNRRMKILNEIDTETDFQKLYSIFLFNTKEKSLMKL
jgi:hypothetical protein